MLSDQDSIGPDSSLWLRPLRQLFKEGKPVGPVAALRISLNEHEQLPLGMLTYTDRKRLVFWPILPPNVSMICAGQIVDVFDHITLEFPSQKSHVTAYDSNNKPIHLRREWRTHQFPGYELKLWFTLLVRVSVLRQHGMEMQRLVKMPTSDKARRIAEFEKYAQSFSFATIASPPHDSECDYIYCGICLAPDTISPDQIPDSILPTDADFVSNLDAWDRSMFAIATTKFAFANHTICIATACPPGKLKADVVAGFPQSR